MSTLYNSYQKISCFWRWNGWEPWRLARVRNAEDWGGLRPRADIIEKLAHDGFVERKKK